MKRLDITDITTRVRLFSNSEYHLPPNQTYTNSHTKLKVVHKSCGNEFETTIANLLDNKNQIIKSGSTHCRYESQSKAQTLTLEDFIQSLDRSDLEEYELVSEYKDTNTPISVKHNCGLITIMKPREFKRYRTCPNCTNNNTMTSEKKAFRDFIRESVPFEYDIEHDVSLIVDNPNIKLDVYIPEMNIAFQYRTTRNSDKTDNMDDYKDFLIFRNLGIRVIMFFESEWYHKNDIVKNKILHILGYNKAKRINASDCMVVDMNTSTREKNEFLETNHIQGKDASNFKYGLTYNGELVSVMTFTKARASLNQEDRPEYLELSRFATDINYIVRGAFNKILKYLVNETDHLEGIETIGTFANLRFSNGDLYDRSNFKFIRQTKPSYWWYKKPKTRKNLIVKLSHRFTFNKYNIHKMYINGKLEHYDSSLNDKQNMKNNGYSYIYDYGNLYFELDLNKYRR